MSDTILVTGGAGYIGSHVCKKLFEHGFKPVVYDNLVYGHSEFVKWGPLEEGDLTDTTRLNEVFAKYKPKAVFHFAAYAYVGESVEKPAKYYQNNVVGTLNLLDTMREYNVPYLVFSSTCATYGMAQDIPISEEHPQQPINPYGKSKFMIEQILDDYEQAYGLKYTAFRYFNAAGADDEGEIGEKHDPETHLIPLVLQTALGQRDEIYIYGTDYDTRDGTCIRDFIHVNDLADAHIKGLKRLFDGSSSEMFNLGTGTGYSVKEIIDKSKKITDVDFKVIESDRREGDPAVLIADYSKAQKELNWEPKYSLEDIIKTAWNWHKLVHDK